MNSVFLYSAGKGSYVRVAERVGLPLFKALIDYDSGRFDAVVDGLLPVKYEITDGLLNGSRAQVLSPFSISPDFVGTPNNLPIAWILYKSMHNC